MAIEFIHSLDVAGNLSVEGTISKEGGGTSENWDAAFSWGNHADAGYAKTGDVVNTNYYLSGASFNTGNGVLSLTVTGASNQSVDLDGRYLTKTWKGGDDYIAGHHPEGRLIANAYLANDLANARRRGSTVTITGKEGWGDVTIDRLFDGLASFASATAADFDDGPIIIEFDLPRKLTYGAYVGIGFGNPTWRCKDVKIEAYSQDKWVTCIHETNNAYEDVYSNIPGNSGIGTSRFRITLNNPNYSSVRICHIWAYNYASDLWSQAIMPRSGGRMYGDLSLDGKLNTHTIPSGSGTLALTTDIPTDFVSAANGGTFSNNVNVITNSNTGIFRVGRYGGQEIKIYTSDLENKITSINDQDENQAHTFILDRKHDGDGPDNFIIQRNGTNQLHIDKDGNTSILGTLTASGYNNSNWDTAYGWGDHSKGGYLTSLPDHNHDSLYLSLSGGTISSSNTYGLKIANTNTSSGAGIEFSDNENGAQRGYITHYHTDTQSYGSGASLILSTNQSSLTVLADGKLMYKEGIYSKPSSGTGAGTRKDSNWDTAYGWGDHSQGGYIKTQNDIHSKLYNTDGNADNYTKFGIYRNYSNGTPTGGHNTLLHVSQTDGKYGFQITSSTTPGADGMWFRQKGADFGDNNWFQFASREWANGTFLKTIPSEYLTESEGDARYLKSLPSHNHDSRYTSTDASGDDYTFEISDMGNLSGNKWYHVADLPNTNGGLHIRGIISNHVETFSSQKVDLFIQSREDNSGNECEISGSLDVLHGSSSGTDRSGIRVIQTALPDPNYGYYKVYVRVCRYSMIDLRMTRTGSVTWNTNHSSPATTEPQPVTDGRLEIDTSAATEGNYVVRDSEIRRIFHEGHQPEWSEVSQKPTTFPPSAHNHDGVYLKSESSTLEDVRNRGNGISGAINFTPDTGDILQVDGQVILKRTTANGAITIGHDDSVIIAGGDTSSTLNNNINNANETVYIGAEGGMEVYAFPDNMSGGWNARKTWRFSNTGDTTFPGKLYPTAQSTHFVNSTRIQNWQTAYGWGNHADAGYISGFSKPQAPSITLAVVGESIEVTIDPKTTTGLDHVLVFSSVAGADYGLISVIPPEDFSNTMSVIDNSFDQGGTQSYRVYAVRQGVYSDAGSADIDFAVGTLEPTNVSVVPMNESFYVQWDEPSSKARFVKNYNVYHDKHDVEGSLDKSNATLIYSGKRLSHMVASSDSKFNKFWIEIEV